MNNRVWMDYRTAAARMVEMIKQASTEQDLVNLAVRIIYNDRQGFPSNEARALCNYVQALRYTNDTYGEDIFRAPMLTVQLQSGDCNNKAVLYGALARAVGFPVRLAFLFSQAEPNLAVDYPMHVWAEVDVCKGERSYKRWVACEATPLPLPNGRLGDLVPFGATGEGGGKRLFVEVDPDYV